MIIEERSLYEKQFEVPDEDTLMIFKFGKKRWIDRQSQDSVK